MKAEWRHKIMGLDVQPSYRVIAFFLADHLNWATMDCWVSHSLLAKQARLGEKTVQRAIVTFERALVLSVYRKSASRYPMRYAPRYLPRTRVDAGVRKSGQEGPVQVDRAVHQSFLQSSRESALFSAPNVSCHSIVSDLASKLSYDRAERINLEPQIAELLGGRDKLDHLAEINDEIVTRLCEAHCRNLFLKRQIRAAQLAAGQTR